MSLLWAGWAALFSLASEPERACFTPVASGGDPSLARTPGTPEILYVNFDGGRLQGGCGNDARYNCSELAGLFGGYVTPFRGTPGQRVAILQAAREDVADFGVRIVTERPPDDVPYTMVMYGGLGEQSFAGVAPYVDCGDVRPWDLSFSQPFTSSSAGATVLLHEAGHTWGFEHVDSEFETMNPFESATFEQAFLDQCLRIVADVELTPTAGSCNDVHVNFCQPGYQNSWRQMLYLFGPSIPDVEPPTLDIVEPPDGGVFVLPENLRLRGKIDDDLHPQAYTLQIFDGDELLFEERSTGLDLVLRNPPAGDYALRVRVSDEAGNSTEDVVGFTILPEGSPEPEPEPRDEPGGEPSCSVHSPPEGRLGWVALVLLAAARRRRT